MYREEKDAIRAYIESLVPTKIDYPVHKEPDYVRVYKEYVQPSAINFSDIIAPLEHLSIDTTPFPNLITDRTLSHYAMTFGLLRGNVREMVSIKFRTPGPFIGTTVDCAVSDIVILATDPDLEISLHQSAFGIYYEPFHTNFQCKKNGEFYEYRPVNDSGQEMFRYPYILPLRPIRWSNYGSIRCLVRNKDGNHINHLIEYTQYSFSAKISEGFDTMTVVASVSPEDYFSCGGPAHHGRLINTKKSVEHWKENCGRYLVEKVIKRKLTFLMGLQKKDTSKLSRHFRGFFGDLSVASRILSYLSDVDP